jgi:hypothetical protein
MKIMIPIENMILAGLRIRPLVRRLLLDSMLKDVLASLDSVR